MTDGQTDGQTDEIAIAYTRYSIYAVARKKHNNYIINKLQCQYLFGKQRTAQFTYKWKAMVKLRDLDDFPMVSHVIS